MQNLVSNLWARGAAGAGDFSGSEQDVDVSKQFAENGGLLLPSSFCSLGVIHNTGPF